MSSNILRSLDSIARPSAQLDGCSTDGTYLYVTADTAGIDIYDIVGETLSFRQNIPVGSLTAARDIIAKSSSEIYVAWHNLVAKYSYDGSTFSLLASSASGIFAYSLAEDSNYLYASGQSGAFTKVLDKTTLSTISTISTGSDQVYGVVSIDGYLFIGCNLFPLQSDGIYVYLATPPFSYVNFYSASAIGYSLKSQDNLIFGGFSYNFGFIPALIVYDGSSGVLSELGSTGDTLGDIRDITSYTDDEGNLKIFAAGWKYPNGSMELFTWDGSNLTKQDSISTSGVGVSITHNNPYVFQSSFYYSFGPIDGSINLAVPLNSKFSVNPASGLPPLIANFTNESTAADSFLWDFGDGNTSTGTDPSNTYLTPGSYTVTLTAESTDGDYSSSSVIKVNSIPWGYQLIIYVDSANGLDTNTGAIDSPYLTLSKALEDIKPGGLIVLQTGTYTGSSPLEITKNVSIQAAYGSTPNLTDSLHFLNAQGLVRGIRFTNNANVFVDNGGFGGIEIQNCGFDGSTNPIDVVSANYVSIHQNRFYNYNEAIRVSSCREMTISANYFYSDTAINGRAIYVADIDWLDVYQNTIYGAHDLGGSVEGDVNLRIVYISMNSSIVNRGSVSLPSFANSNDFGYDVAVDIVNGTTQEYGKDYTVINSGATISWTGRDLQGKLSVSDTLRVMYSEGPSPLSGDAISVFNVSKQNSRIDSNNINDASIGVYFTDSLRVRYNNFNGTVSLYSSIPYDNDGNITGAPNYVDASNGNFKLNPNSPDIDNADPDRWSTILQEMGIGKISGHYTGISLPTGRPGIAPYNRNVDKDGLRRLSRSDRDDIGSYEYPTTGINPESLAYINESGFDLINVGSITGPFASIDRGFTGLKDLQVQLNSFGKLVLNPDGTHIGLTGIAPGDTGYQRGRYYSDNVDMHDLLLKVGTGNRYGLAVFRPSYPSNTSDVTYVGPFISDVSGATGTETNPYRTIGEAIQYEPAATTIYVRPGIYPSFTGAQGKKLVGIPHLSSLSLNGGNYNLFDESGWTGPSSSILTGNYLAFSSNGDVHSDFSLTGIIYVRMSWKIISDQMEIKLYNSQNNVLVRKIGNTLTLSHYTGGSYYSASTSSLDTSYRLSFSINGSDVTTIIKGSTTNINRNISLDSGYTDPWYINISYTDSAISGSTGVVSNLKASADVISDVGITGSAMARKVYGIVGEQGLTGFYSLYGV